RARLPHAMGPRDPLLEYGGIPGQVDVDDRVGRLQIQPRAPRVRRQEETRPRVRLEARDDLGALLLGHAPVEAYEVELALSEERLDEIEHRRPLGEERDLAIGLTRDLLEQIVEP